MVSGDLFLVLSRLISHGGVLLLLLTLLLLLRALLLFSIDTTTTACENSREWFSKHLPEHIFNGLRSYFLDITLTDFGTWA